MSFRKKFYQSIAYVKYLRMKYVYHKKIDNIIIKNKCKPISTQFKIRIRKEFQNYGFKKTSSKWHQVYTNYLGEEKIDFIPEVLFYSRIEPALNNSIMYPALEDKNLLDKYFDKEILLIPIVKNIHGFFYLDNQQVSLEKAIEACNNFDAIVIKPSIGTAGGKGVKKIILDQDYTKQLKKLFDEYNNDFIVQEILEQHPQMAKLNSSSLNTIRIITYMGVESVMPLSAVVRIGKSGSFTDNTSGGGMACGINNKGKLKDYAINSYGERYTLADNGTVLKGFEIPCYDLILETVKRQHKNIPHFRLVSWDIAIDNKGDIIIVEFNAMGQDINFHQICNGPLFGNYYKEILEITQKFDPLKQSLKYGG